MTDDEKKLAPGKQGQREAERIAREVQQAVLHHTELPANMKLVVVAHTEPVPTQPVVVVVRKAESPARTAPPQLPSVRPIVPDDSQPYDQASYKLTPKQRHATAYHEAGHAAAAWILESPFKMVSIEPNYEEGTMGRVLVADGEHEVLEREGWDDWRLIQEIIGTLAGEAAEAVYTGRHNWEGARGDLRRAREWAERVTYGQSEEQGQEIDALLRWLKVRVRALVGTVRWQLAIQALAEALLERPTIPAEEAVEIMQQGIQTFVSAQRKTTTN